MFSGGLCLTSLPESLMELTCEKNKFTAVVDFSKIPSELAYLDVLDNAIEGTASIVRMQHMGALRARGTKIAFQAYGVLLNGNKPDRTLTELN